MFTVCVALLCLGCANVPLRFNMLRYVIFPTVSDIKISATHFAKGVGVLYMASRQEIKFFLPAVVKFTLIFFFFAGAPPPNFSPSISTTDATVDPTSSVYYLRRNQLRNWVVGCQVEVTNVLKFVYCADCVRWCVSYKIWQLAIQIMGVSQEK